MKLGQIGRRRVWLALTALIVLISANMIPIGIAIPAGQHPRVTTVIKSKSTCTRAKQAAPKASRYTEKAGSRLLLWFL